MFLLATEILAKLYQICQNQLIEESYRFLVIAPCLSILKLYIVFKFRDLSNNAKISEHR